MLDTSDLFTEYERTLIEITLTDESIVSTSPGYPLPAGLDDLLPLFLITAWNPGGERPGLDANRAAHEELLVRLLGWYPGGEPLRLLRAAGRSPDGSHIEESVAVSGLELAEAIAIARRMRQAALFEITSAGTRVVPVPTRKEDDAGGNEPDALADHGTFEYLRCFLRQARSRLLEPLAQTRRNRERDGRQDLSKQIATVLRSPRVVWLDRRPLDVDNRPGGGDDLTAPWRRWVVSLVDLATATRTPELAAGPTHDLDAALQAALAQAQAGRLPQHLESAQRGPAMTDAADPLEKVVSSTRSNPSSVGWGRLVAVQACHGAAGAGLLRWHLLHLGELGVPIPDAILSPSERARRARPLRSLPPPGPEPDLSRLLCAKAEDGLLFAPCNLVAEIRAARMALGRARTWGGARKRLSERWFAELSNELLARVEPDPPNNARLDLADLHRMGKWPRLYYSEIPHWLPENVVSEYGMPYSTMMDTGVLFPLESAGTILSALNDVGVDVEWDDDGLEDLFAVSPVYEGARKARRRDRADENRQSNRAG